MTPISSHGHAHSDEGRAKYAEANSYGHATTHSNRNTNGHA